MKPIVIIAVLVMGCGAVAMSQCQPGYVQDCNGNCYPSDWIGDGVCDDGVQFPSDFMCAQYNWDNGDCGECPPFMVADCNGNCWPAFYIGNGVCNNGGGGSANFNCEVFGFDGGDCPYSGCTDPEATNYNPDANTNDGSCYYTACPPGQFEDCSGNCWPDELLEQLGNWHCNGGFWVTHPIYFDFGPTELDFNCEMFNFDNGDCITYGCTDPLATNYYEFATHDDGSCHYGFCDDGITDCMGNCIPPDWIGESMCTEPADNPTEHLFYGAYPDQLIQNIGVGSGPRGMCVLPDGSRAYVGGQSTVTVVELTDQGACSVSSIPFPGLAHSCSASIDGTRVFVAGYAQDRVYVINTSTNTIIASVPVGDRPLYMWTSHNGEYVYVSCNFTDEVYMIDTETLAVVHVFNTGVQPRNICTSPDDTRLYTADWLSFTMSVFSTSPPYELIATVPVDFWPQAIWASPDGKYVLVANFGFDFSYDHISVIRTADWQMIARLQTGAGPEDMISIGDDGQYLYVTNWGQPCCFATAYDICCSTTEHEGTLSIIALPDFDAIVPPGVVPDTIPYIVSTLTTIPLEAEYSFGLAAHPSGEFVYALNMNTSEMSVIGFDPGIPETQGDDCSNAIVLTTLEECIEGTTRGFSDDYNEACPFIDAGAPDVVYQYTPTVHLDGYVDLCNSCYDTKVYIYSGECGTYNSGQFEYCNDDFCGVNGWRSHLPQVHLNPGTTYYFVVDGFGASDDGNFTLCIEMTCTSDKNQDGIINVPDILELISGFGIEYDMSSILMFLADFGQTCSP